MTAVADTISEFIRDAASELFVGIVAEALRRPVGSRDILAGPAELLVSGIADVVVASMCLLMAAEGIVLHGQMFPLVVDTVGIVAPFSQTQTKLSLVFSLGTQGQTDNGDDAPVDAAGDVTVRHYHQSQHLLRMLTQRRQRYHVLGHIPS
jgi:hypothetical protein